MRAGLSVFSFYTDSDVTALALSLIRTDSHSEVMVVVVQVVTVAVMTKPADIGPRPPGVRRRQSLCFHCFHRW